jgi:hypothetical protein
MLADLASEENPNLPKSAIQTPGKNLATNDTNDTEEERGQHGSAFLAFLMHNCLLTRLKLHSLRFLQMIEKGQAT